MTTPTEQLDNITKKTSKYNTDIEIDIAPDIRRPVQTYKYISEEKKTKTSKLPKNTPLIDLHNIIFELKKNNNKINTIVLIKTSHGTYYIKYITKLTYKEVKADLKKNHGKRNPKSTATLYKFY